MAQAALATERLSVLVVEDNPADADIVREMLRDADLVAAGAVAPEIHHVETLRDALAAAKRPFDVTLLDLGLPDASGFEGLHALIAAAPELPAVVLTGARDPALGARALVAGAQDFLVKGEVGGELLLRSLRFAVVRQQHAARLRQLVAEQDAVRARDDFISVAAHELRSPLNALHLAIADLQRMFAASVGDVAERRLRIASRGVERLTRLVNTLLDVSRLKTGGRQQLTREPLDLRRVTMDALEHLRTAASAAGCELHIEAREPVVGSWDRTAIEQVLVNLVDNAVKYAPGRPVEVRLGTSDGAAVVAVRDQGDGIAPENAARIFDPFVRGVSGEHSSGLGLGLYITRRLVEAHGGRIELHSRPGAGSTFRVVLPLTPGSAGQAVA